MQAIGHEFCHILFKLGAFKFSPRSPFTYASGLKGPIYCNNRIIISHVPERKQVISLLQKKFEQLASQFDFDAIAALATAAIPHGSWLADRVDLPLLYVRSKPKGHGEGNQIEGDWHQGQHVLILEDLVNQGVSLISAHQVIKTAGLHSQQVLCLVDYQMAAAQENMQRQQLSLTSLTNFSQLLEYAIEKKFLSAGESDLVRDWHQSPSEWKEGK